MAKTVIRNLTGQEIILAENEGSLDIPMASEGCAKANVRFADVDGVAGLHPDGSLQDTPAREENVLLITRPEVAAVGWAVGRFDLAMLVYNGGRARLFLSPHLSVVEESPALVVKSPTKTTMRPQALALVRNLVKGGKKNNKKN